MSKNQVKKQDLLTDLAKEYQKVMNYLDYCFHPLIRNEQDPEKSQKFQNKYKQIGEEITADYLHKIEEICHLGLKKNE